MKLPFTWSVLDSEAACSEIPPDKLLELRISHTVRIQNEGIIERARRQIRKCAVMGLGCIPASALLGYVGVKTLDARHIAASIVSIAYSVRSAREIRTAIAEDRDFTMQNNIIDRNLHQVIADSMADNLILREVIEADTGIAYRDVPIAPAFIAESR